MNPSTSVSSTLAFCSVPCQLPFTSSMRHNNLYLYRHDKLEDNRLLSGLFAENNSNNGESNPGSDSEQTPDQTISDPSMFFELMSPIESVKPDQMSAAALAYLGDVVFELFVRSRYVWPSRRMSDLQNKVVSLVRAEFQSKLLQKFVQEFTLTSAEQGVMARGRNANLTARKKGKGGESAFQDSTAFEALIGYVYICDKNRFNDMISWIKLELDRMDNV